MKTITIDNDTLTVPSRWGELTTDQVLTLAKLVGQNVSYFNISVRYCLYLLGLKPRLYPPIMVDGESLYYVKGRNKKNKYLLSTTQVHAIGKSFDWLFKRQYTENKVNIALNPLLTSNVVKDIKVRFSTLRGPEDVLGNISWAEFVFAETYLARYHKTNDPKWLAHFLATLWRPLCWGTVLPFSQAKVTQQAKRTIRVKPHIALAAIWYYEGCKAFLAREYPRPFGGGGASKADPFKGYMDLTVTLARADATKAEDVLNANLHFTLKSLDVMLQQNEKK